MRRFVLPVVVLAVMIAATILATDSNDTGATDPSAPIDAGPELSTPLLSARRAPEWLRQPATDDNLAAAVSGVVEGLGDGNPSCLSVYRGNAPIAEINPDVPLVPGHLQRLATLAAFDNLGSTGFLTEVVRHSADVVTEGVLDGDIWLVGGADPVLGTDVYVERFADDRAHTSLEELADDLVAALADEGVTTILGSVIGDESKYGGVDREIADFWTQADIDSNLAGPISALLVNNGFDAFPAEVDPAANSRAANPAVHAAAELTALIEAAGIAVEGDPAAGVQPDAVSRRSLTSIESPPIDQIARRALVDATTAEMLYREIALRSGRDATGNSAALSVAEALVDAGIVAGDQVGNTRSFDGSGISDANRLTCDLLVNIVGAPEGALATTALGSVDETQLAACAPTTFASLDALATAREEVTAVAGRAVAANGDVLTFALVVNWGPDPATGALAPRGVCDDVVPALLDAVADHPVGPALEDLTPLAVVTGS